MGRALQILPAKGFRAAVVQIPETRAIESFGIATSLYTQYHRQREFLSSHSVIIENPWTARRRVLPAHETALARLVEGKLAPVAEWKLLA